MIPQLKLDMSGPALRAFSAIARDWSLTEREQRDLLGGPTPMTLREWTRAAGMRERVRIPDAALIRIQLLLQIRVAIKAPMPNPHDQMTWLRCRNRELDGRPPLELMAATCQDLARVRDLTQGWAR